jgi:hypothetical protein
MDCHDGHKRLIYTSCGQGSISDDDVASIYAASHRNNGIDGVTGILLVENRRFLQLLEGPAESVDLTFARIRADERHRNIVVLDEQCQAERVFADWAMAGLPGERPVDSGERLGRLLRHAPTEVTQFFPALDARQHV